MSEWIEFGGRLAGHSIWAGLLAVLVYWLLSRAVAQLRPAARVWIGWFLFLLAPCVACLVAVNGFHRIPLGHRIPVSVPIEWVGALMIFWIVGSAVYLLRLFRGARVISSIIREGKTDSDIGLVGSIGNVRNRFSPKQVPGITMSSRVSGPILTGLISPRIVLPQNFRKVATTCLDCVLAHELAHFLRRDIWFLFVQRILEGLFFYHPALRWLSAEVDREREKACDDLAVSILGGNRMEYASALLEAETATRLAEGSPALAFGGESTADRAARVAFGNPRESGRPGSVILAVLSLLAVVMGGWSLLSILEIRTTISAEPPAAVDGRDREGILIDSDPPYQPLGWSGTPLVKVTWRNSKMEGREVPVFKSVPLIEKGGKVIDLSKAEPRLFPEVPNRWLRQYRLDLLDGAMLSKDPDGDLFTTLEEYHAGTQPDRGESHPDRINLLRFHGLEYQAYRIEYRANPDRNTVQLTRLPSVRRPTQENFYVRRGEVTGDGRVRLEEIGNGSITIRDEQSNRLVELGKKERAEFRTNFAALEMRGGERFYRKEGTSFYLPGGSSGKWTLSRVTSQACDLVSEEGEEKTIPLSE